MSNNLNDLMKNILVSALLVLGIFQIPDRLVAQTQTDGIMMPKGEFCVAIMGESASWDQYWEGTLLIRNGNIGTFHRNAIMPMAAYGISDRLMVLAQLPWVSTRSTGGQLSGVSGLQDIGIAVKGNVFSRDIGQGTLHIFASGEYSRPVTNYLSDYMPYSLGLGTDQVAARLMAHYKLDMGLYARVLGGYIWRGYTRAERDYYYADGSYYTRWMDVPSAIQTQWVLGYYFLDDMFQLEMQYTTMHATSGDDIRRWNMPQPTNRMNMDNIGGFLRFYVPGKLSGLSFIGGYQHTLQGRNMGKATALSAAITYQFLLF